MQKIFVLFVILFAIVNVFKIYDVYREQSPFSVLEGEEYKKAYEKLYKEYGGMLDSKKKEKFNELYTPIEEKIGAMTFSNDRENGSLTYNTFSDYLLLYWLFEKPMSYDISYAEYANSIVENAVLNIDYYQKNGNEYETRKNYVIAKSFYQRELKNFYNIDGIHALVYYDFSSILILCLCTLFIPTMVIRDRDTQMRNLIMTTQYGGKELCKAKLKTIILITLFFCILFYGEDFISFRFLYQSMEGIDEPLYIMQGFKEHSCNS